MTNEQKPPTSYLDAHSCGILKVAASTDPKKLASAIIKKAQETPRLAVRAAGDSAVGVMVKACIVADGQARQRGKALFCTDTFEVVRGANDSGEVTIIVRHIVYVDFHRVAALYQSV